jgi:hypothetical protein
MLLQLTLACMQNCTASKATGLVWAVWVGTQPVLKFWNIKLFKAKCLALALLSKFHLTQRHVLFQYRNKGNHFGIDVSFRIVVAEHAEQPNVVKECQHTKPQLA